MKTRTAIVALDRQWSRLMLHGEVVTNRSRPITDEIESPRETFSGKQVMEEVVQCFLRSWLK
jgi:hypothetical protein